MQAIIPGTHKTLAALMSVLMLFTLLPIQLVQAARLDLDAPVIALKTPAPQYIPGQGYTVQAEVTDNQGISQVKLMVRHRGSAESHQTFVMQQSFGKNGYSAVLPEALAATSDLEYYIQAEDSSGNITQTPHPNQPQTLAKIKIQPVEKTPEAVTVATLPQTTVAEKMPPPVSNIPELGPPPARTGNQKQYLEIRPVGCAGCSPGGRSG